MIFLEKIFSIFKRADKGFLATIGFSILLLIIFYAPIIIEMGSIYFSVRGDGLLTYYNTLYHVLYDADFMRQGSMNYPFGENSFFTNNFFLISSPLQSLKEYEHIIPLTVFIFNLFIIGSFVVTSVVLYKIFRKLNLPQLYSAFVAVGITFISPQIQRIPGHFYLSYSFVLPVVFYLLMLIHEKRKWKYSILLGVFTFVLSIFQLYYFALIGAVVFCFWIFSALLDKKYRNVLPILAHISIQLIIPYALITLWVGLTDDVTDRTNNPWGYFHYTSSLKSVFLPMGKPIMQFIQKFIYIPPYLAWEGIAFIGIVAVFATILMFLIGVRHAITLKFKNAFQVTDVQPLNIFLYTGILTLFFSFGYPFKNGFEHYLDYFNVVKQIRSIGRFAWIFFYVINIVTFYKIYHWIAPLTEVKKRLLILIVFAALFYDVFSMNYGFVDYINKKITALEDRDNDLLENQWLKRIDVSKYQAIFPLPYFHMGSESTWHEGHPKIVYHSYIASLKTGLPITAVHLSRTSLSQTYKSMAVALEPYRPLEILEAFSNKKPLLILTKRDLVRTGEKHLLDQSTFLFHTGEFEVYELPFSVLETISSNLARDTEKEMQTKAMFKHSAFYSSDSIENFIAVTYDSLNAENKYQGNGGFKGRANEVLVLFEGKVPALDTNAYTISFWINDIRKDMVARGVFHMESLQNGKVIKADSNGVFNCLTTVDVGWVLVETTFKPDKSADKLRITLTNRIPGNPILCIDELLIKPASTSLYKKEQKYVYKNNRFYR